MKTLPAIAAILLSSALTAVQSYAQVKSPKDVVGEFWRMEINGGRLTPDGWNRAAAFFLHPSPRPDNRSILVVSTNGRLDEMDKGTTRAEVYVGCSELGHLDSNLRFIPSPRGPALLEMVCKYDLVLTESRSEWKIADGSPGLRVSVGTAVRYVADMRQRSSDPVVKKNADAAIAALRKLK
ncbi:MAG TPA: hypothetical protein VHX36_03015 [Candidatus Acidoferrales bacterium]|jgi:hypothetical protein|nr:hypothetical protein [Candidatus Acidoferrales bacterium]